MKIRPIKFCVPFLLSSFIAFSHVPGLAQDIHKQKMKVKITVGEQVLTAIFDNNATSRALTAKFPLTLPMMDLYSREMCYRFPEPLPSEESGTHGYEVGDIAYWTPRHSFVIFYEQNDEVISNLQKIGHIDTGVEIFEVTGDSDVTIDLLEHP